MVSMPAHPASASDPTATDYSFDQCSGSLMPYPADIRPAEYPDSLVPVFINHVGRHGARFPASAANTNALTRVLEKADSLGTITKKDGNCLPSAAWCRQKQPTAGARSTRLAWLNSAA